MIEIRVLVLIRFSCLFSKFFYNKCTIMCIFFLYWWNVEMFEELQHIERHVFFFYNTVTQVLLSYNFRFRSVQYFFGTTDIFLRILFYNFFFISSKKWCIYKQFFEKFHAWNGISNFVELSYYGECVTWNIYLF